MRLVRSLVIGSLLLAAPAPAGAAAAETRTFLNTDHEFPTGDANELFGPAKHYPSTIAVAGVDGTVTNVTATVIGLDSGSADDIDMALVGPNEEQVMLMSDACGLNGSLAAETFTFDDAAPSFLSDNGPCASGQIASFRPSNYENPELDDFSEEGGGPPPPYTNALSDLAGGSPDGSWELFVLDDNEAAIGFSFEAWALTLEIEPPAPPAPVVKTVIVPGPTVTEPAPAGQSKTGKRAAALAKCKTKKTKNQRAKCRAKAQKLPL